MNDAVRQMVLGSPRLVELAGGTASVEAMWEKIEDVWLDHARVPIHCDFHRSPDPKATIVFQPGSGAYGRVYFLLGGLLAKRGFEMLAIDRPGHGLSGGEKGDCTIEEAIAVAGIAIDHARRAYGRPVVLMGSSMGGLLTIFGLLKGLQPDLAVAHNFLFPGKLFSLRLRAKWITRYRTRPYPLTELVHGFESISQDPAIQQYVRERSDPDFAWQLSARSVASLFGFQQSAPRDAPETLVLSGSRDVAIPALATRFFTWLSGLPRYEYVRLAGAGHMLFHDHLDVSVPLISRWIEARLKPIADGESSRSS